MSRIDIFEAESGGDIFANYGNRLFNCAVIGANQIRRLGGGGMSQPTWVSVLFEHLFFYVSATREIGLAASEDVRRERIARTLADQLVNHAVDYIFDAGEGNDDLKKRYLHVLAARLIEYGKFPKLMPDADGSSKMNKTAVGAFSKKIAELAGEPNDAGYMVATYSHIQDSLELLDMDVFAALAE